MADKEDLWLKVKDWAILGFVLIAGLGILKLIGEFSFTFSL